MTVWYVSHKCSLPIVQMLHYCVSYCFEQHPHLLHMACIWHIRTRFSTLLEHFEACLQRVERIDGVLQPVSRGILVEGILVLTSYVLCAMRA